MNSDKQQLKKLGAGLVILAAAAVMFNQLFDYIAGLSRMITFIAIALSMAFIAVFIIKRFQKKKPDESKSADQSDHVDAE